MDTGDVMPAGEYTETSERVPGPGRRAGQRFGGPYGHPNWSSFWEGLHLHKLLNKHTLGGRTTYTE